ncbi:hypothetical protein Ocin01_18547 [Orchesella cincta]|uniref:Uncharacterized protein n=1 Tax=Orchesella cincta TaxID=48709 RepID=A0A1D2M585_ORCCI|nr:hypothetical protein Ocin01_18547 [Orchesella cincta]
MGALLLLIDKSKPRKNYCAMDFFLIFVLASSAFIVEAQTCGEADTAKPPYPSLPPGAPVFMHFSDTDRRRSNVIASMFRESG